MTSKPSSGKDIGFPFWSAVWEFQEVGEGILLKASVLCSDQSRQVIRASVLLWKKNVLCPISVSKRGSRQKLFKGNKSVGVVENAASIEAQVHLFNEQQCAGFLYRALLAWGRGGEWRRGRGRDRKRREREGERERERIWVKQNKINMAVELSTYL